MSKTSYRFRMQTGNVTSVIQEAAADDAASDGSGKYRVTIIKPGLGSTGMYTAANLEASAYLFTAGTQMYLDHPDYDDRPERSLRDLAGKFLEDATIEPDGSLSTTIEVYPSYNQIIKEKWDDIGISINAWSWDDVGPDGVVPVFDGVTSVDFVTKAGAGGALLEVLEAQRDDPAKEPNKEETNMAEFEESANKLVEAIGSLVAALTTQAEESKAPVPEVTQKEEEPKAPTAAEAMEAAKALVEADLPDEAQARVTKAIEAGTDYKAAIAAEQDYIKSITESVKAGKVEEKHDVQEAHKVTGFRKVGK